MASSGNTQPKAIFGAGNLYTPEEPILHSFSKDESTATKLAPIQTLSPPVSPEEKTLASFSSVVELTTHDAPLYSDHSQNDSEAPLFGSDSQEPSPVKPEHKRLSFEERVAQLGITNLGAIISPTTYIPPTRRAASIYCRASMAELEGIRAEQRALGLLPLPMKSTVSPRDEVTAGQVQRLNRSTNGSRPTGITKIRSTSKAAAPKPRVAKSASSPIKAATPTKTTPQARRTPRAQTMKEFDDRAFPQSAQQSKHKRAPPTKKVAKEDDTTWRELPDYCPPVSSLDNVGKSLKAQWKNNPLDISNEPDFDQLDPRERDFASELRLKPVQYFANKRRMFMAKLEHIKMGKGFTKTAAQTVTNIDVNKTSRLWEAFDKVGWWEDKWFAKWVDDAESGAQ